jgi:hypothetical protein
MSRLITNLNIIHAGANYFLQTNELAKWLKVVYIFRDLDDPMCSLIADNLRVIDRCHPNIAIDFVLVQVVYNEPRIAYRLPALIFSSFSQGTFNPEVVAQVCKWWSVLEFWNLMSFNDD